MKQPLYVTDCRTHLARREGQLAAVRDGEVVASAPFPCLSEVVLFGPVGISTPALHTLLRHEVPVVLLRADGQAVGRLEPSGSPHTELRQVQLERTRDPHRRLAAARAVVVGKLTNQQPLLRRQATRRPAHAERLRRLAGDVTAGIEQAEGADRLEVLCGIEGAASRRYFAGLRGLLAEAVPAFQRRDRHGHDPVNALLNYTSALVRETVVGTAVAAGLDPYVPMFHRAHRGRPALAFDLMEQWRPVLLEATVLALVGRRQATAASGSAHPSGWRLDETTRRALIAVYHQRLAAPARAYPPPAATGSYHDAVLRQARCWRGWLQGHRERYEPFRWHT